MQIAETIDLDDYDRVIEFLVAQSDKIKKLEKREQQLLDEIEDFQELLKQNDNVCYDKVIGLIDERIKKFKEGSKNLELIITCSVGQAVLEDLKKELMEDGEN